MTKDQKSKLLTAVVVVILCLIFAVGFVIGLNSVLAMEGAYPPNVLTEGKTPAPETEKEAVDMLFDSLDNAKKLSPMTSAKRTYDMDTDSVLTDGTDQFTETVKYVMNEMDDEGSELYQTLMNGYEGKSAAYGEDIGGIVRTPVIYPEDVESFNVDYIYYHCSSCGENSDEPLDRCELCGSDLPYQMKYKDEYSVELHLKTGDEEILKKNFDPADPEEVLAAFDEGFKNALTVNGLEVDYSGLTVNYRVRRLTGELTYLGFTKEMNVSAAAEMDGIYASLGSHAVEFRLTEKDHFDFTWPALTLSAHEMSVEPKGNDNLQAALTCDEPTKQTVTWTSSDENILTVDDEGYFKAGKEAGTAVITASFDFNGKTYTDSCTVDVKYSVESMKMSKSKIKLSAGDTFELNATVSPKKSTVSTKTWYTEDESIAKVDENGVVTAVAPGTVTVYALSDDGYFKSSCEVTVR